MQLAKNAMGRKQHGSQAFGGQTLLRRLTSAYWRVRQREEFSPGKLALLVHPFYFARRGLYEHVATLGPFVSGRTLDVGCGTKPYQHLCNASEYVGLEIDTPLSRVNSLADHFYDGRIFPFQEEEFDSVVVNQVFEHVFNPQQFLNEIERVLRPGGVLLMTVPFVWDEHLQPNDFARYSSFGIRHLLRQHGFEIVEQRKTMNDVRVIFQLVNDYIYKTTVTGERWRDLLTAVLLMAPFNLLGEALTRILPSNDDLYLDNVVLARKVAVRVA